MQRLKDAISGQLFLHNQVRGHLFYIQIWVEAHKQNLDLELLKAAATIDRLNLLR